MISVVKRLRFWRRLGHAGAFLMMVGAMLSIYFVVTVGLTTTTWLMIGATILSLIIGLVGHFGLRILRSQEIKKPRERRGHEGEPGAWECSCGRINTSYRDTCLSCGSCKPLERPF